MFFVYILRSLKNGKLYIGYTSDVKARLRRHNNGQETFTKRWLPWELIYHESYLNKTEALKRERYLKNLKNPKYVLEKIVGISNLEGRGNYVIEVEKVSQGFENPNISLGE